MLNYTALNNSTHLRGISGIYCIRNVQNGKQYVGRAEDVGSRLKDHLRALRSGKHHSKLLQAEFSQYGEQEFECCLLEQLDFKTYRNKTFFADVLEFAWTELFQAEYGGARKGLVRRKFRQKLQDTCQRRAQARKKIDRLTDQLESYNQEVANLNTEIETLTHWLETRQQIMQP